MTVGWLRMDDLFTPDWADAAVNVGRIGKRTLRFTFKPPATEIADGADASATVRSRPWWPIG